MKKLGLVFTALALALFDSSVSFADEPQAHTALDKLKQFLSDNVIGRTVAQPEIVVPVAGGESTFSFVRTFDDLQQTPAGVSFRVVSNVHQMLYDLDPNGKRLAKGTGEDRNLMQRYFIAQKQSTGELLGYELPIADLARTSEIPYEVSTSRVRFDRDQLVIQDDTALYTDLFDKGGKSKPGCSEVVTRYWVEDGKLHVAWLEKAFDCDPNTLAKTLYYAGKEYSCRETASREFLTSAVASENDAMPLLKQLVDRANALFAHADGKLMYCEQDLDKGEMQSAEWSLPQEFKELSPGVFEQRALLKISKLASDGHLGESSYTLTTQLRYDQSRRRIALVEVLASADAKAQTSVYAVEPIQDGFRTALLPEDFAKAATGDWSSCEWVRLNGGLLRGVRRYKGTDRVVTWLQCRGSK